MVANCTGALVDSVIILAGGGRVAVGGRLLVGGLVTVACVTKCSGFEGFSAASLEIVLKHNKSHFIKLYYVFIWYTIAAKLLNMGYRNDEKKCPRDIQMIVNWIHVNHQFALG